MEGSKQKCIPIFGIYNTSYLFSLFFFFSGPPQKCLRCETECLTFRDLQLHLIKEHMVLVSLWTVILPF